MHFWRFIDTSDLEILHGHNNYLLIALSWLLAAMASYNALSVSDIIAFKGENTSKKMWMSIGSISMGLGIWSMHFTGMLAFHIPVKMTYNPSLTAISVIPAILGSIFAIRSLSESQRNFWNIQKSALALAAGIGAMHYIGMEAMEMEKVSLAYIPLLFIASILIAHYLASTSLYVRFMLKSCSQRQCKFMGAGLMGLTVSGMHYTAMGAAVFYRSDAPLPTNGVHIPHDILAVTVIIVTVLLLGFVIVASTLDYRLMESQEAQGRLMATMPDGLLLADNDLNILSANSAACQIFGYNESDILNKKLGSLIPLWNSSDRMRQNPQGEGVRSNHSVIDIEANIASQMVNQKLQHIIVLRDVTERNIQARKLQRLRIAVDQAHAGIAVMHLDGSLVYANDALKNLMGIDEDGLKAESFARLVWNSVDKEKVDETLSNNSTYHGKERLLRMDGSEIPVDLSISAIKDWRNACQEILIVARDTSVEDRLEEKLRQAQKLETIGQLSAGIAHEINTPAQFVNDNINFIADTWNDIQQLSLAIERSMSDFDPESLANAWNKADMDFLRDEVPKALQQSGEGMEQIRKIVQAMKSFAHPGQGQQESACLNELIKNAATITRSEWRYVAEVELDLEPELAQVTCDQSALNQVFLNIIVNAAHAIEERFGEGGDLGIIRISTRNTEKGVELNVSDNGAGMTEEVKQRIFDPFFTTKEVGKGTGQGLSIAYGVITEAHRGSIEVLSTRGEGSTFIIKLPCSIAPAPANT